MSLKAADPRTYSNSSDPPDFGMAPLPLICISVSLLTCYSHLGLVAYVRDLRHLYGRYLTTAFSLHVAGTTMKLASFLLDRLNAPKAALVPANAAVHLLELLSPAWAFVSVLLLWLDERRRSNTRRLPPLVRVYSCAKYFRCLAASTLFAVAFVSVGLFGSFRDASSVSLSRGNNNTTVASAPAAANVTSWDGFLESVSHAVDLTYTNSSLVALYRDRNCATPHRMQLQALRPVAVSYAYMLVLPALLLQLMQAPLLVKLGSIVDAMLEERRQASRVAINAWRVFAKLAVSNAAVHSFSLMALLLYHSCEGVCLWHIHFMLQALQAIFLCITCLFSRPSIEILMERFGAKEETKLESGLGLLAAVMHSKRAKTLKGLRPAGRPNSSAAAAAAPRGGAKFPFKAVA